MIRVQRKGIANPEQQVVMDENVVRQAEEQYAQLEERLREMQQQNEVLTHEL